MIPSQSHPGNKSFSFSFKITREIQDKVQNTHRRSRITASTLFSLSPESTLGAFPYYCIYTKDGVRQAQNIRYKIQKYNHNLNKTDSHTFFHFLLIFILTFYFYAHIQNLLSLSLHFYFLLPFYVHKV